MQNEKIPYKIYLSENEMPKAWYNLRDWPAPVSVVTPLKPCFLA